MVEVWRKDKKSHGGISLAISYVGSGKGVKGFMMVGQSVTGYRVTQKVPASMSLGHALDWEELAAGERPGQKTSSVGLSSSLSSNDFLLVELMRIDAMQETEREGERVTQYIHDMYYHGMTI